MIQGRGSQLCLAQIICGVNASVGEEVGVRANETDKPIRILDSHREGQSMGEPSRASRSAVVVKRAKKRWRGL